MKWFDGSVWASAYKRKVRVQIEGLNVTAEVYITRTKARDLRDSLNWILAHPPDRSPS